LSNSICVRGFIKDSFRSMGNWTSWIPNPPPKRDASLGWSVGTLD
jgi:hypothetical protein